MNLVPPLFDKGIPQFEDRARIWTELSLAAWTPAPQNIASYCDYLRLAFRNGQVRFQTFHIAPHPIFDWYASRNQFHEMGFFCKFWEVPLVNETTLERPFDLNFYSRDVFSDLSPFLLGGTLACLLAKGGAHAGHDLGSVHAKQIAEASAAELICDRYDDVLVYESRVAWSPFFRDVAWDFTCVVFDKRERLIHTLSATDTD